MLYVPQIQTVQVFEPSLYSSEFTPANFSNPGFWLDISDPTTTFQDSSLTTPATANNDPLGGVVDKTGNGHHFIQATSTKRPKLVTAAINGLNDAQGDKIDDLLANTYTEVAASTWYFVMSIKSTGAGGTGLYMASSGGTSRIFLEENSPRGYSIYAGSSLDSNVLPPASYTTITMIVTWNGASSIIETQGVTRKTGNPGSNFASNLSIFGDGTHIADGAYCEVFCQQSVGTSSDKSNWRAYALKKWGAS